MRVVGAVMGGLAGITCAYLTYLANGCSYQQSVTKGAGKQGCGRRVP